MVFIFSFVVNLQTFFKKAKNNLLPLKARQYNMLYYNKNEMQRNTREASFPPFSQLLHARVITADLHVLFEFEFRFKRKLFGVRLQLLWGLKFQTVISVFLYNGLITLFKVWQDPIKCFLEWSYNCSENFYLQKDFGIYSVSSCLIL